MKIFLIAGEASGDLHAAALAREILAKCPDAAILGMGGPAMAEAGVELVQPIDEMQIMGFVEVLTNFRRIKEVFDRLKARFREEKPDGLILVDYPGFNLRFAAALRDTGAKVLYYISPQVWAWHRSRLKTMRRLIDRMLVIFDFEQLIYEQAGIPVEFVGHPLLDQLAGAAQGDGLREELRVPPDETLIALLPGSRRQEVRRMLPTFQRAAAQLLAGRNGGRPVHFAVASVPDRAGLYPSGAPVPIAGGVEAAVIAGRTPEVIRAADLAWVSSGTATIEAALLGTPLVCCYRGGSISYALASLLVDLPCISLVNIVAGKPVVPELLQYRFTPRRLARVARELLADSAAREQMREEFAVIRRRLGGPGASARAAEAVLRELS